MQMTEMEFDEMRLGTYFLKLHFFFKREENQNRFIANLIRLHAFNLIKIQISQSDQHKLLDPTSLWKYTWEEEQLMLQTNTDEVKESVKRLHQLTKKISANGT